MRFSPFVRGILLRILYQYVKKFFSVNGEKHFSNLVTIFIHENVHFSHTNISSKGIKFPLNFFRLLNIYSLEFLASKSKFYEKHFQYRIPVNALLLN